MSKYEFARIHIFLPLKENTLLTVYMLIQQLYTDFGGCTHSTMNYFNLNSSGKAFPGFIGYWFDPSGKKTLETEDIVYFVVDVDHRIDDPRLEKYFCDLKEWLEISTREDEAWIISHPVWRFINL